MTGRSALLERPPAIAEGEYAIYEHPLPAFVEAELERLYRSVFASLARVRSMGLSGQVSAFVARRAGEVSCVLLFHREGRAVHVLNEAVALQPADIESFARTLFAGCPTVDLVSFPAVRSAVGALPFPYQRFDCLEDIVLELPPTADAYFAALGKNMRSSLKRYQKKIAADFPGFRYAFYEKGDIGEQDLAALVRLSSARIASKNQLSTHSTSKTRQLTDLVKQCGVVLVATIDGRVCAGVICTQVGGNFFMHVVAHDPAYDEYRIGKVCCYLSICDAIARGAGEYHFLWGRYEYKYRLLGEQRDFDKLVIYRSRLALLRNLKLVLGTAWRGYGRRAKWWLLDAQRSNNRWARLALAAWRRAGARRG